MGVWISKNCCYKKDREGILSACPASFFDITAQDIHGQPVHFRDFRGKYKAFVCVNLASSCTLTSANYRQLVKMHEDYGSKGLLLLGFPCNQFLGQESKCEDDIVTFVRDKFGVKFMMFSKIEVNGANPHPLYAYLRKNSEMFDPRLKEAKLIPWNFFKFILDQKGRVVNVIQPHVLPDDFKHIVEDLLNTEFDTESSEETRML